MDSRVILVGSLVGFLKKRSPSVVTRSPLHLLSCLRATARRGRNISRGRLTEDGVNHAARPHPAALF